MVENVEVDVYVDDKLKSKFVCLIYGVDFIHSIVTMKLYDENGLEIDRKRIKFIFSNIGQA